MQRRQLIKHLYHASGGLIAAALLPACERTLSPIFSPTVAQGSLPDHLITPLDEFYVQSYALPPQVNATQWRLEIAGAVEQPIQIALEDILNQPQDTFYLTMECIGNPKGGNQIGNAQWTGTPLQPFLNRAKVKPEAVEFVLHGADYYETTLPVRDVMRSDVRLVHQMNHAPLPQEHGYPVRLIVPGHFGQKQPKWLVKIEAIATPKRGFWERQGWSNTAEIATHALPRQVQQTRVWNRNHEVSLSRYGAEGWGGGVVIAGVALDRSSPIQQVRVSADGGKTWQTAEQNLPTSPHEWTLWRYLWRPTQPGTYSVLAQAISRSQTQPLEDSNHWDGSSGVLNISVTLQ